MEESFRNVLLPEMWSCSFRSVLEVSGSMGVQCLSQGTTLLLGDICDSFPIAYEKACGLRLQQKAVTKGLGVQTGMWNKSSWPQLTGCCWLRNKDGSTFQLPKCNCSFCPNPSSFCFKVSVKQWKNDVYLVKAGKKCASVELERKMELCSDGTSGPSSWLADLAEHVEGQILSLSFQWHIYFKIILNFLQ